MGKSSSDILLEICAANGGSPLAAALVTGLRLARDRMSSGDYDDWCDAVADAALD